MVDLQRDDGVPFTAMFVRHRNKSMQRSYVAQCALAYLRAQHERGVRGAVIVDMDDTLIDGNESVINGFQTMRDMYSDIFRLYNVHVVSARPDYDHGHVMDLLHSRGFYLPPDRLHLMRPEEYEGDISYVERFKWGKCVEIARLHGGVVARFGDRLWDVAHSDSPHTYLHHVKDSDCYMFVDPRQHGTVSFKLPGR